MSTAQAGRKFLGGTVPNRVPEIDNISNMGALARHVRARSHETIRFLTNLAYLRMRSVIPDNSTLSITGAAYQDARGTTAYPRAHVLPGNVRINGMNVPDLVASQPRLMAELTVPLKRTNMLPVVFNYADRLFEDTGAIDVLVAACRWLVGEQKSGEAIGPNLMAAAYDQHVKIGYGAAYEAAAKRAETMSEEDWGKLVKKGKSTITEGPNQGFVMIDADESDYRTKRDTAAKCLRFAKHLNSDLQPKGVLPSDVQDQVTLLDSLGGSSLGTS
jgi:hypothetical protein